MGKRIKDEFAGLPISRQYRYQLRMKRDKRCIICGEPAVTDWKCLKHMVKARERQRKKLGLKRRLRNSLSYKLQKKA
jgi:hypothetical protein